MTATKRIGPVRAAGLTLGMGLGGFLDGIVFHQIFQMHNMLSARVSTDTLIGAKTNMVWDGVFHAFVWTLTAAGIRMLWRAFKQNHAILSGKVLIGSLLMGWATFNMVEGLLNHHLLHLHHVYEALGVSAWDYAFLFVSAGIFLSGSLLVKKELRLIRSRY